MEEENKDKTVKMQKPEEKKGKGFPFAILAAVFVVVAVVGGFLLTRDKADQLGVQETANDGTRTTEQTESDSDFVQQEEVDYGVSGTEYRFDPEQITVTEGETVRIRFVNDGRVPHNFMIDELGVGSQTLAPGESETIEFTPATSGTFSFYCSVGNHRELGMEADLIVE